MGLIGSGGVLRYAQDDELNEQRQERNTGISFAALEDRLSAAAARAPPSLGMTVVMGWDIGIMW
jgi:hypothetical protein